MPRLSSPLWARSRARKRWLRIIAKCLVSTVNGSEAVAKLVERGVPPDMAESIIFGLPFEPVDFDRPLAAAAGRMWPRGRRAGLSLGDRACLALAEGPEISRPLPPTNSGKSSN